MASNPAVINPAASQTAGSAMHRAPSQEDDVERAVSAIEQSNAEQIQDGSEQREEQIAQRRDQRLRTAVDANQRHGGEGQKLQRDVEIEQIAARERGCSGRPRCAWSRIQNANGARASAAPDGVPNLARA